MEWCPFILTPTEPSCVCEMSLLPQRWEIQDLLILFSKFSLSLFLPRCCSVAQSCLTLTPWTAARQASLSFTISRSLLKFMSIESVMPSSISSSVVPFSSCLQSFPASYHCYLQSVLRRQSVAIYPVPVVTSFSMSRQEAGCKYLSWSSPSPFQEMQTGGWL